MEEVAKNMGVAENVVLEAIRLSSETIEDKMCIRDSSYPGNKR